MHHPLKYKTLTQLAQFNYHIFDGMYENEPYSPEQYKERLKGKNPWYYPHRSYNYCQKQLLKSHGTRANLKNNKLL